MAKNNLSSPPGEFENCVLVVGGSGFIGRALCDQLSLTGLNIVATSRTPFKHTTPYQQVILDIFNEKNRIELKVLTIKFSIELINCFHKKIHDSDPMKA